jgi:GxxExxY protein
MPKGELYEEELTHSVIGAFFDVYNELKYGLLELAYQMALERELRWRGHDVARELYVPIYYKGEELTRQRIDMLVDGRLVVETKATKDLHKSAARQVYSYLRAARLQVGLLLHFGPEPAYYRVINSLH